MVRVEHHHKCSCDVTLGRSGPESLKHLTACSETFLASDGGRKQGYQGEEELEGTAGRDCGGRSPLQCRGHQAC
jgi:hypothetical protein